MVLITKHQKGVVLIWNLIHFLNVKIAAFVMNALLPDLSVFEQVALGFWTLAGWCEGCHSWYGPQLFNPKFVVSSGGLISHRHLLLPLFSARRMSSHTYNFHWICLLLHLRCVSALGYVPCFCFWIVHKLRWVWDCFIDSLKITPVIRSGMSTHCRSNQQWEILKQNALCDTLDNNLWE